MRLYRIVAGLVLFLALGASAWAATPDTIYTSGCFTDRGGNCLINGSVTFTLSGPATVTGGGSAPVNNGTMLDANGKIPSGTTLYGNDQLTPSGTTYTVTGYNSNRIAVFGPVIWSITGTSPIDLSPFFGTGTSPPPVSGSAPSIAGAPTLYQVAAWASGVSIAGLATGTAGNPLLSGGSGSYPAFGQLNLGGSGVTGILPVTGGGTGTATPTPVAGANIAITGTWPNQTTAFSGTLPIGSGGTGAITAAAALANLNGAGKPATSDHVQFVSNGGSDSNDGLSWSTAKLTIGAACAAIPNQDSTCALLTGFGTIYVAPSFSGTIPAGFLTGGAPALNIIGPSYIQSHSTLASLGSIDDTLDESYFRLHDGGKSIYIQAGPRGKESAITGVSITSNVLTVTVPATNPFAASDAVYISGTQESFLNGQTVTVLSTGLTSTAFTANFTHANFTNSTDTGEGVTSALKANSTWNLPDAAEGGTTDQSGVLAGVSGLDAHTAGNCVVLSQAGTGNTGGSGILQDSGFGCNQQLVFPTPNNKYIEWINGAAALAVTGAAVSANRTITLPDPGANDSVAYLAATQTLTNKSTSAGALVGTVASGTATMTTAAIPPTACGTVVTVAASGVATTDVISWSLNAAPVAATGLFTIVPWPTAGNVNFQYCNPTAASQTPSPSTLNWKVVR